MTTHRKANRQARQVIAVVALLMLIAVCASCDPSSSTGAGEKPKPDPDKPTIVSMTPAITQMLIDMGLRNQIVGVSKDDDESLGIPVCGTYNDPVLSKIIELKPDIVLTQSGMDDHSDVPQRLRSWHDKGVFKLGILPYSRSITDVGRALTHKKHGLGQVLDESEAAERAKRVMMLRLELVADIVADAKPPRVLLLLNPRTLEAIGTGVTHDELLKRANASNATARLGGEYLKLDRSKLISQVSPDVILILEPGGTELTENDPRLRAMSGLTFPAMLNNRVHIVRHRQAMLPATSIAGVFAEIASLIHPGKAEAIRKAYAMAEDLIDKQDAAKKGKPAKSGAKQ